MESFEVTNKADRRRQNQWVGRHFALLQSM